MLVTAHSAHRIDYKSSDDGWRGFLRHSFNSKNTVKHHKDWNLFSDMWCHYLSQSDAKSTKYEIFNYVKCNIWYYLFHWLRHIWLTEKLFKHCDNSQCFGDFNVLGNETMTQQPPFQSSSLSLNPIKTVFLEGTTQTLKRHILLHAWR